MRPTRPLALARRLVAIAEVLAWVARNKSALYSGPIGSGVIDMDEGDHRKKRPNPERDA